MIPRHARTPFARAFATSSPALTAALLTGALALTGLTACSDSNNTTPAQTKCRFDADCVEVRERCDLDKRVCVKLDVPECAKDADCASGACTLPEGTCLKDTTGGDMGDMSMTSPGDMSMNPTDMNDPVDMSDPTDMGMRDTTPPRVTKVQPGPDDGLITADQTFLVSFSEPLLEVSVAPTTLYLRDAADNPITTEVSYDALTQSVLVKPTQPLRGAEMYELVIDGRIIDESGNFLRDSNNGDDLTYRYFSKYEETPSIAPLVQKWAPVIHQGVFAHDHAVNWRYDVPTRVDFDGDWAAHNNMANATLGNLDYRAHVYYHVTETVTHYFLYYFMYYPSRELVDNVTGMRDRHPHDMTGVVMIIDKATDRLLVVDGLRVEDGPDTRISYHASDSPIRYGDERVRRSFNPNTLIDGTHYPMYIPSGRHEACNWQDGEPRRPLDLCKHPDAAFPNGDAFGVILRPGDTGQTWSEATMANGKREMTYKLIPFVETFWSRRGEYGLSGLYERGAVYKPNGARPSGYEPNQPHILPNALYSTEQQSFGKVPFNWLEQSNQQNAGQWLLDPAYELRQYYSVPAEVTWSQQYCNNSFLGVDERGNTPDCSTP